MATEDAVAEEAAPPAAENAAAKEAEPVATEKTAKEATVVATEKAEATEAKPVAWSSLSLKGVQRNEAYLNLAVTVFKGAFYKLKFGSKGDPLTSSCSHCDGRVNEIADKVNEAWFAAVPPRSERRKRCRASGQ